MRKRTASQLSSNLPICSHLCLPLSSSPFLLLFSLSLSPTVQPGASPPSPFLPAPSSSFQLLSVSPPCLTPPIALCSRFLRLLPSPLFLSSKPYRPARSLTTSAKIQVNSAPQRYIPSKLQKPTTAGEERKEEQDEGQQEDASQTADVEEGEEGLRKPEQEKEEKAKHRGNITTRRKSWCNSKIMTRRERKKWDEATRMLFGQPVNVKTDSEIKIKSTGTAITITSSSQVETVSLATRGWEIVSSLRKNPLRKEEKWKEKSPNQAKTLKKPLRNRKMRRQTVKREEWQPREHPQLRLEWDI